MDERNSKIFDFVKMAHRGQVRKYTNEPYHTHPLAVSEIVKEYITVPEAVAAALMHDVVEDTDYTLEDIREECKKAGYSEDSASFITDTVSDLTDEFTSENYPDMNRKMRKAAEAKRLWDIPSISQTIKCADLIHNTESITEYDKKFAGTYLKEKKYILRGMNKGNFDLYIQACAMLYNGITKIEEEKLQEALR